jgi:hypothetical protein
MNFRQFALGFSLALAAACGGDDPAAPNVDGVTIGEIILVGAGTDVVYSHDDHWHGAPLVDQGSAKSYAVHFVPGSLSGDNHEIAPQELWFTLQAHPEYELRAIIEDPSVATWSGDRLGGSLQGTAVGSSRITFVVRRGTTTIYEAPPLNFRVR